MNNDVLIIGNGFDLYHKLPTRYTDFLVVVENWAEFWTLYRNNIKIEETENDYFDLKDYSEVRKTELLEFLLKYTTKGYVDFCKKCAGWTSINPNLEDAAIQKAKE